MEIITPRLTLRDWHEEDRDAFAALHADPDVMADLGGPFDRMRSDTKLDHYRAAYKREGICRWAVTDKAGALLGYCGIMPHGADHPLGTHHDIGWRLIRAAWGQGYATEAARAALGDGFTRAGFKEVLAYTVPDNLRSQAVIARLGLVREVARDFTIADSGWPGLVWVARRSD